jgi:hypothetical protein
MLSRHSARTARSRRTASACLACAALIGVAASFTGCARVHQKDREFLADPILQITPDPQGAGMESHNLPRREGSTGGSSGSGGGCGC